MYRRPALVAALFLGLSAAIAHADSPTHIDKATISLPGKDSPPQTEFAPDTPKIVLDVLLRGFKAGDKVTASWIAEKTKIAPPNYKIASTNYEVGTLNTLLFSMTKPNAGWPAGDYRVDVTYNGEQELSQHFKVVATK
jgi:hypothetical protein